MLAAADRITSVPVWADRALWSAACSHDDSEVSLRRIKVNDKPVECRAHSKTKSRFEDGEVTLDCGFTVPATLSADRLTVKISLHHLQFDKAELLVK